MIHTPFVLYMSERSAEDVIGFHITDRLTDEDVHRYRSIVEGAVAQFGKVCLLFQFENLSTAELESIWKDLKFTTRLKDDLGRIAVVGDWAALRWAERQFASVHQPEIRFFTREEYDRAWNWVKDWNEGEI